MAGTPYRLEGGEKELYDGYANRIDLFGGGGGRLVLTDRRLLFTDRRKTCIGDSMPLSDVLHVGRASGVTVWSPALLFTLLLKGAVRVTLRGGRSQRFAISAPDRWIGLIDECRKSARP